MKDSHDHYTTDMFELQQTRQWLRDHIVRTWITTGNIRMCYMDGEEFAFVQAPTIAECVRIAANI